MWPLILTKAMFKVLSVNLGAAEKISLATLNGALVHMLTGWLPETIPWLRVAKETDADDEDEGGCYLTGLRGEIWRKYEQSTKEWTYPVETEEGQQAGRLAPPPVAGRYF